MATLQSQSAMRLPYIGAEDDIIFQAMTESPSATSIASIVSALQQAGSFRTSDSVRNRVLRLAKEGKLPSTQKISRKGEYNRKKWDVVEDAVLLYAHAAHGDKWRFISNAYLVNRSDTAIRNRYARLREADADDCSLEAIFKEFDREFHEFHDAHA